MTAELAPAEARGAVTARPYGPFLAAAAVMQIVAWGATYYLPSILERGIAAELGMARDVVFGGISVMLLIGAVLAPAVGRHLESHGARWPLVVGTALLALGLAVIGLAEGLAGWLVGWALFGLALPLGMSLAIFAAIAQTYPQRARQGITLVMLFGGLSNGVMWPLMGWLDAMVGWRMTCLLLATLQAAVCVPLALWMRPLAPARPGPTGEEGAPSRLPPPQLRQQDRRLAFWLIVAGSGISGIVSWGLPLYFVPMLVEWGLASALAIGLASLSSYAISLARAADLAMAKRFGGMRLVLAGALMPPLILLALLFARFADGPLKLAIIALCMALYGFAAGLISAGRATLPLDLFGTQGYAATLGKLSLWLNLMFAASPFLFAMVFERAGTPSALWLAFVLSTVAAAAFWRLDRLVVAARHAMARDMAAREAAQSGVELARDTA